MKTAMTWFTSHGVRVATIVVLLLGAATSMFAQVPDDPSYLEKGTRVAEPANGSGVMVAGELWDSFLPPNAGPYYSEATQPIIGTFMRIGNFDRFWTTPTHAWPGGWTNGNFWGKGFYLTEFNPDVTWNPPTIGGVANPSYKSSAGAQYAFASFKSSVLGANSTARNYKRETKWVDATKRHHAIYEAGWPTTIGVDVQVKIHQFALNWNNFNDFIIVEVTLINTGQLDMNADGTAEKSGNVIQALTMLAHGEFMCSYFLGLGGSRGANRFGSNRAIGYVGDNDPLGAPWHMMVGYPGESTSNARDMGLNDYPLRFYTDVWSAWSWLGIKRGMPAGSTPTGTLADKNTIYGTHPIGSGAQRGWYHSAGQGRGLGVGAGGNLSNPKDIHTAAMGVWYTDGGKERDRTKLNLAPNPKFFLSGTTGDPTTFNANPAAINNPQESNRPSGDRKLFSLEATGAFEAYTGEPTAWTKGFTGPNNFDGDMYSGVGPFSMNVGDTITVVWAEVGGYRLQGVANAMAAARWAFENGYNSVPEPPTVPEIRIDNTLTKSIKVRWDNRADTSALPASSGTFAGYKIYKASQANRIDWLSKGMQDLDNYWMSTTVGPTPSNLKQPINPNFTATSLVAGAQGVPDSWGPYELVAVIPAASRANYTDNSVSGYNYVWEDLIVDLGFKYWYYVAAYTSGATINLGLTYSGGFGNTATTTTLESPNINRNGATGLWANTYPFAEQNAFFPKTAAGLKALGAAFIVKSALADPAALASGASKISVKPNPYKKKALFDSAVDPSDHKVTFYNLPPRATITILDVSGQIVKQINFASSDPNNGSVFWDLFSKDGIEVASGLYIYVVEYGGGQHVSYLSILR